MNQQTTEQEIEQMIHRVTEQATEPLTRQTTGQTTGKTFEQTKELTTEQTMGQTAKKMTQQTTKQTVEQTTQQISKQTGKQTMKPELTNLSRFYGAKTECLWNNLRLISQCPENGANLIDARKCLYYQNTFEDFVPVTDRQLGLHFKNSACARCNGLKDFFFWQTELSCYFHVPSSLRTAFIYVKSGRCAPTFQQSTPDEIVVHRPVLCVKTSSVVNSPKQCKKKDDRDKCESFFSFVNGIGNETTIYQNRYCFLCQDPKDIADNACHPPPADIFDVFIKTQYSALLNWRDADNTWTMALSSKVQGEEPVHMECPENSVSGDDPCKITSCPNGSEPFLNSTYCVTRPLRVKVAFNLKKELIFPNWLPKWLPKSSPSDRDCFMEDANDFIGSEDLGKQFAIYLTCDWEKNIRPDIHQARIVYDIVSSWFQGHVDSSLIVSITLSYVSVMHFSVAETRVTFTRQQLQVNRTDQTDWVVSMIGSALSVLGLMVRIIIQAMSPLLHTHPGKMQFCLCVCLIIGYSLFLAAQYLSAQSSSCWTVSSLMHLAFLSSIFWMNAVTYDLWGRFRYGRILSSMREKRSLKKVIIYSVFIPSLVVGCSVAMDKLLPGNEFSPSYGARLCWINKSKSLLLFFVAPISVLSLHNVVLILLTFRNLHAHYKSSKFIKSFTTTSPILSISVCTKMACLTGGTWLLGVVAGLVNNVYLWTVFSAINSSYGLIIAVTLLWNTRLWKSVSIPCQKKSGGRGAVDPNITIGNRNT